LFNHEQLVILVIKLALTGGTLIKMALEYRRCRACGQLKCECDRH
jgi:hypothetical protein